MAKFKKYIKCIIRFVLFILITIRKAMKRLKEIKNNTLAFIMILMCESNYMFLYFCNNYNYFYLLF